MKTTIKILSALFVLSMLVFAACEDPNGPDEGDVREKYVATWTCTEQGGMTYPVTISLDANNSSQVLIANFHYLGNTEKAYAIATTNNLTLPTQDVCGNTINGSGTLVTASKITLKYYVDNQTTIDTVDATYTK